MQTGPSHKLGYEFMDAKLTVLDKCEKTVQELNILEELHPHPWKRDADSF